ncbi:uroporphyrin-III C-methyltransferase, partial [Kappamyces sp. JEL0680]
ASESKPACSSVGTQISFAFPQPPALADQASQASPAANALGSVPSERWAGDESSPDDSEAVHLAHYDKMNHSTLAPETRKGLYLVGAGPGNPDLITLQAYQVLQDADLVVSDRLIPSELLELIDPAKLVLSSFKVGGASDKAQDESNDLCLAAVQEGKMVVRFKTGDPFVFGRAGEEILFFRKHGIEPVVVPGLSSVFAAPQWNGIPITHRGSADQVLVLSGRGAGGSFPEVPRYHDTRTTIILMSLARLQKLCRLLESKGYPSRLPCAVIEKGTWQKGERVCCGTLETIADKAAEQEIKNPAMLVVGNVVGVLNTKL